MSERLLSGKTALVTGAAVRVGRAIALSLAGAGCDLVLHYRSSREEAASAAREIESLGRRAVVLAADLSRPAECRELVRTAAREIGDLDFLVHSASNFHRAPLEETMEAMWDDSMAVNARAGFLLAREAAAMLERRGGRIVLISDLMASDPPKGYLAHAVSKAAVEGLVRALAVELAPSVAVNGVAPGTVLVPEGTPPDVAQRYARKTLLQRSGDPDDVARTVLFLLAGPTFLTGQIVRVDGGQSIR
ncbi:MAG TPA: SDR family oxidoreductase [Thermoanaerobaculia bacterium]|nr:SDR family oxidoreductase [Thermoanaerobaculia bacterium]